jgi:DNA replication protein DnaC
MPETNTLTQFKEKILNSMVVPPHAKEFIKKRWEYLDSLTPEGRDKIYQDNQKARTKEAVISFKDQQKQQKRDNCGLTKNQWDNTFVSYKPKTTSQEQSKIACVRFANAFPDVQKGIMLWGEPGLGKDHLLHSITQEILKKDNVFDIRYYFSTEIEQTLKEEWNEYGETEKTNIEEIMLNTDLLLIGDLQRILYRPDQRGNPKKDAIWNAIYSVIDKSESTGYPIICASGNFPLESYDKLGKALGSRLAKIMHWHEVKGEDARRIKDGG